MCEGVCARCREKVQWRFKYDKYKPLKNPAKCQECKQKTVHKAYRTFCDYCSSKKRVCPSCCLGYDEIEAAVLKAEKENAMKKDGENQDNATHDDLNIEMDEDDEDNDEGDEDNEAVAADDDDEMDGEENADDNDGKVENDDHAQTIFTRTSAVHFSIGNDDKIKDKYSHILEGKYSKNRQIGKEI
jgi:hypothetical protein